MAGVLNTLLVECRMALGLTQKELGDLLGRDRRTIQRWEQGGTSLLPTEAERIARALQAVRPDLAAQIAASAGLTFVPAGASSAGSWTGADRIDAVVQAAADVMGVAPAVIRPAVAASFQKARQLGLDVEVVLEGLGGPAGTKG